MFNLLNDMKIARKVVIAFAGVLVAIAVMGTIVFVNINTMELARRDSVRTSAAVAAAQSAKFYLARQELSYRGYLLSGEKYYADRLVTHRENFNKQLDEVHRLSPENGKDIDAARKAADDWVNSVVEPGKVLFANPATRAEAVAMVGQGGVSDTYMDPAEGALEAIVEHEAGELVGE